MGTKANLPKTTRSPPFTAHELKEGLSEVDPYWHIPAMKTVTLKTVRTRLDSLLRLVAAGEEIEITEKRKTVARLVPPGPEEADWTESFAKLEDIWGGKPLPGKPGSQIVREGRR